MLPQTQPFDRWRLAVLEGLGKADIFVAWHSCRRLRTVVHVSYRLSEYHIIQRPKSNAEEGDAQRDRKARDRRLSRDLLSTIFAQTRKTPNQHHVGHVIQANMGAGVTAKLFTASESNQFIIWCMLQDCSGVPRRTERETRLDPMLLTDCCGGFGPDTLLLGSEESSWFVARRHGRCRPSLAWSCTLNG